MNETTNERVCVMMDNYVRLLAAATMALVCVTRTVRRHPELVLELAEASGVLREAILAVEDATVIEVPR